MVQALDIVIVPSGTIKDMGGRPIPKDRPFLVLATSTQTPLMALKPIKNTVQLLEGTTVLEKAVRDGVIIHPYEVDVVGFNFRDTLFRKENVYTIDERLINSFRVIGSIKPEFRNEIVVALNTFL